MKDVLLYDLTKTVKLMVNQSPGCFSSFLVFLLFTMNNSFGVRLAATLILFASMGKTQNTALETDERLQDELNPTNWAAQYKAHSLDVRIKSGSMIHSFTGSEWEYRAAWSRDGRHLAAVYKNKEGLLRWGVVDVRDIEKSGNAFDKVRPLDIAESNTCSVTWHPNGSTLLFSYHLDGRWCLVEYILQNDHKRVLDIPGSVARPSYSPDGERLAYSAQWRDPVSQEEEWRVRIRDLKTGVDQELGEQRGFDATNPEWSPDGRRIAYERADTNRVELEIFDVETGRRAPAWIPHYERCKESQFSAAWSGDGRYLAFFVESGEGDTLNGNHLMVVDVRDGSWADLSDQEEGDCLYDGLAWNPRKNWLFCNGLDGFHTLEIRTPQAIDGVPVLGRLAKWLSLELPAESMSNEFRHGLLLGMLLAAFLGLAYRMRGWAVRLVRSVGTCVLCAVRWVSFRRSVFAKSGLIFCAAGTFFVAGWGVWVHMPRQREALPVDKWMRLPHPLMTEYDIASSELTVWVNRVGPMGDCLRAVQKCSLQADEIATEMVMVFRAQAAMGSAYDVATPAEDAADRMAELRKELKQTQCPADCRGLVRSMETVLWEAERFYRRSVREGTFSVELQKSAQKAYEVYVSEADRFYYDPICLEDEVSSIYTNDCVALAEAGNDWVATMGGAAEKAPNGCGALADPAYYSEEYPLISGLWAVLNGRGYGPYLASAFLCWRRAVQDEQYGHYEWANIPNREYNMMRFRTLERVGAYLRTHPLDVHAQAQRDVLLSTPNLTIKGLSGEVVVP